MDVHWTALPNALRSLDLFGDPDRSESRRLRSVLARLEKMIEALRKQQVEIEACTEDMQRERGAKLRRNEILATCG
jgi:hypothetical protein